jgi:trigger factor
MPMVAVRNYKGVEVKRIHNTSSAKKAEINLQAAILDKVLEANDIEVPQDWVEHEIILMVIEHKHKIKYESMSTVSPYDFMHEDVPGLLEAFREEAFKLVKTRLVIQGIIEAESFEVTKAELEEEAKKLSVRQKISIEMVKNFLGEDFESLKEDLLVRKAFDFIYANAVIN